LRWRSQFDCWQLNSDVVYWPTCARRASFTLPAGDDTVHTDTIWHEKRLTVIDWIQGDLLGLDFPAHHQALREGGAGFLTRAFRAAGAIPPDNSVKRITELEECTGGSTGRKLLLSVEYEKPAQHLHTGLFVKFSRDFDNAVRDRARFQMEDEVRFGLLSRNPAFPIAVPICYFADFHHESGTGVLVTQRIPYGSGTIEPHYEKCLDYDLPEPLAHYRAIVESLARLAGTHRSGRLTEDVDHYFPFDAGKLAASPRHAYTPQQVRDRVARYADFAAAYPQLLPPNIRSAAFLARLDDEAPRLIALEPQIRELLAGSPEYIALCHWNANVDNAWFMRTGDGLECGLLDWGQVSQMNVAMALWGCLSGAELALWDNHLDELLALFADEFRHAGGAQLEAARLKQHLALYAGVMGLNWLLDVPPYIVKQFPALPEFESYRDARFRDHEAARTQLQMMTVFLNLWQRQDMDALIHAVRHDLA